MDPCKRIFLFVWKIFLKMQMLQIPVLKCCSGSHAATCKPTKTWVFRFSVSGAATIFNKIFPESEISGKQKWSFKNHVELMTFGVGVWGMIKSLWNFWKCLSSTSNRLKGAFARWYICDHSQEDQYQPQRWIIIFQVMMYSKIFPKNEIRTIHTPKNPDPRIDDLNPITRIGI